jgi:hypothetical protein
MERKKQQSQRITSTTYDKNYINPKSDQDESQIYSEDSVSMRNDASPCPPTELLNQLANKNNDQKENNDKVDKDSQEIKQHTNGSNDSEAMINISNLPNDFNLLDRSQNSVIKDSKRSYRNEQKEVGSIIYSAKKHSISSSFANGEKADNKLNLKENDSFNKSVINEDDEIRYKEQGAINEEIIEHRQNINNNEVIVDSNVNANNVASGFVEIELHAQGNGNNNQPEYEQIKRSQTDVELDYLLLDVNNEFLKNENDFVGNDVLDDKEKIREVFI